MAPLLPLSSSISHQQSNSIFLLDPLYCEEERWIEEEEEQQTEDFLSDYDDDEILERNNNNTKSTFMSLLLVEQDIFWEDDELISLFSKEKENPNPNPNQNLIIKLQSDLNLANARRDSIEWILRVNAHYSFSPLTAVLSINYLNRFLSDLHFQKDKPWLIQLIAVACLSLAAKVEETHVPLLLDLQVEETKYVFEAKTIQRMELLVLSTLHWKMNPVTPLSFMDHIMRRLVLNNHLHWELMRRSERLLLSVISDSRFLGYVPSVLAAATMLHTINQVEPYNPTEIQNQLMEVLKLDKEKVDECYQLILKLTSEVNVTNRSRKRKYESIPGSPNGIIDVYFSSESSDCSNDSWEVTGTITSSSPNQSVKKNKVQVHELEL